MLQYRGTYRVEYEVDKKTGKALTETFIPCLIKKGSNIYRHSDTVLNAYIPSSKIIQRLIRENAGLFTLWQDGDGEGTILFLESEIERVAKLLKAKVLGKDMSPRPKRKLNLSDEQRKASSERMKKIRQKQFESSEN